MELDISSCFIWNHYWGAAVQLSGEDLRNIEQVFAQLTIVGARYPEQLAKMVAK